MTNENALKDIWIRNNAGIRIGFEGITGISEKTREHLCQRFQHSVPLFRKESKWTIIDQLRSAEADYISILEDGKREEAKKEIAKAMRQIIEVLIEVPEQRAAIYDLWLTQNTPGY